jgi:DNA-binding CsgD family transcriptional regulator
MSLLSGDLQLGLGLYAVRRSSLVLVCLAGPGRGPGGVRRGTPGRGTRRGGGAADLHARGAAGDRDARCAAGYRDAALRVLRRLGERPRPAAPAAAPTDEAGELAALTPREREVAALVAEGRTNRQIGAQLHLSEKTIEKHVSSAMAKLGVSSRTGIARLVERQGTGLGT